jgi:hypothetical protein
MKVEIRHLKTLERPNGDLLEIVEINANAKTPEQISAEVGSALIDHGIKAFGENASMVNNETIFGGHVRNKLNGECIIAV